MKRQALVCIVRAVALGCVVLVAFFPLRLNAQAARCFPQTDQCIQDRFRSYWEQNGELAVFGYPITAARQEIIADTGESTLTQWFERNRFELNTENPAPYDVLLGRLGDDVLRRNGRNWQQEGREPGPQNGCLWFNETGHNVCNQDGGLGFKQYWETHGLNATQLNAYQRSLALFGVPLTAPRMERNSSGDTVLTQWFERARFEWHPSNAAPFRVLLGLLGNELRGSPSQPGNPTPVPAATTRPNPTALPVDTPTATNTTVPATPLPVDTPTATNTAIPNIPPTGTATAVPTPISRDTPTRTPTTVPVARND